jgi:hypothetical protein
MMTHALSLLKPAQVDFLKLELPHTELTDLAQRLSAKAKAENSRCAAD